MKKTDYTNQRSSLLTAMQDAIDAGKLEEAAARKTEIEALDAKWDEHKEVQASLNALRGNQNVDDVAAANTSLSNGNVQALDAGSDAYRSAFLKHMTGRGEAMTQLENAAFTHTTTTTAAPLPTTMINTIWDLVSENHSIVGDVTVYRTGTVMEVVKHTAIVAGKAKKVAEGVANDDEQNTFVKVTLAGHDFSKTVEMSYAMANMSLDAFENYITQEIAAQLGEAMAEDVVATIEAGVNAANKLTTAETGKLTYADCAKAFGLLKRTGPEVCIYGGRSSIYNYLVGMVDNTGRPIFQQTAQQGALGHLLGGAVKEEAAIADGKLLIGGPKKVLMNMVTDILIETDKDVKAHKYIYSGYARGEACLIDDKAFVVLTIKAGS